jgi:parvulin-like peptidyl-prolyl isomerase
VSSPFGQHLVLVTDREAESQPPFAEMREKVQADWIENRRNQARDDFQARMRKRYQIQIEWPKGYEGLPAKPEAAPKTKRVTDTGGE